MASERTLVEDAERGHPRTRSLREPPSLEVGDEKAVGGRRRLELLLHLARPAAAPSPVPRRLGRDREHGVARGRAPRGGDPGALEGNGLAVLLEALGGDAHAGRPERARPAPPRRHGGRGPWRRSRCAGGPWPGRRDVAATRSRAPRPRAPRAWGRGPRGRHSPRARKRRRCRRPAPCLPGRRSARTSAAMRQAWPSAKRCISSSCSRRCSRWRR